MSNRVLIQTAIMTLVDNYEHFHEVAYSNGVPQNYNKDTAPNHAPKSKQVNELSAGYVTDKNYGVGVRSLKSAWIFELLLDWSNIEIDVEPFIEEIARTSPLVSGDENNLRVRLQVTGYKASHPTTGGIVSGTSVAITVQAVGLA